MHSKCFLIQDATRLYFFGALLEDPYFFIILNYYLKTTNMKSSIFIAIIATFVLSGCSQSRKANKGSAGNHQAGDTLGTADNNSVINKYWKLITLEGQKVTMSENQEREAHFILKPEQNSITGFAGCNTFGGTYTLKPGWSTQDIK